MMKGGDIAGLLIRQARLGRDWSQEGLCRGICAPSYLSKIEQGKAAPSPEDGASAAPVGPGLDAGTRESGTMLEGPALRQPRLRLLL